MISVTAAVNGMFFLDIPPTEHGLCKVVITFFTVTGSQGSTSEQTVHDRLYGTPVAERI